MYHNVFTKLRENIEDFDSIGVYLNGRWGNSEELSGGTTRSYHYSQREVLASVDFASASKFKSGVLDDEGERKTYINIVNFFRDVAKMKIDVNVSDYILEPLAFEDVHPVTIMDRRFKAWCDENSYNDQIDEMANDLVTYGSTVVKRIAGTPPQRVPLRSLRNTQTAVSLKEAVLNNGYVVIEQEMFYGKMEEYPEWKLEGLDSSSNYIVYERYALAPVAVVKEFTGETIAKEDWDRWVPTVQILVPDEGIMNVKRESERGTTIYIAELDEIPLEECHINRVDGRWLGIGEVEKQLENQIARNLTANLRRRSLLWATKKIYQSTDDEVQRNLIMEVRDGEVIRVKPNGQLSQVNTQTQHAGEFSADEAMWKENSQQISFAFEVATGESLPSGTPFRLGAILDRSVNGHFTKLQDTFSNFLKRTFFSQILPIFQETEKAHILVLPLSDEGLAGIKEQAIASHTRDMVLESHLTGDPITWEAARMAVESELSKSMSLFVPVPDGFYKNIHTRMRLNINEPISADVTSLTTLYQILSQKGDPRADGILRRIMMKMGDNYDLLVGAAPATGAQPAQTVGVAPGKPQSMPSIEGMTGAMPQGS